MMIVFYCFEMIKQLQWLHTVVTNAKVERTTVTSIIRRNRNKKSHIKSDCRRQKRACIRSRLDMKPGIQCVGHVRSDSLVCVRLGKEDLRTFMSYFEGCQHVKGLYMSNLCRVSGKSIQLVYNDHEGIGGKGGSESLRELTAGAEKIICNHLYSPFIIFIRQFIISVQIDQKYPFFVKTMILCDFVMDKMLLTFLNPQVNRMETRISKHTM